MIPSYEFHSLRFEWSFPWAEFYCFTKDEILYELVAVVAVAFSKFLFIL